MTAAVERLRVAIIGPGRISDLHAIEYVRSPHTEIAAVCKPDTEGALARARSWGIEPEKVYADWRDCLADDSIDAFEVLLPHHMHLEVALAALATGKHLSIQKPVGFTVAECGRFVEAAEAATARGQVVRVFENFLFYPPVARLVELVRERRDRRGALGAPEEPLGRPGLRLGGARRGAAEWRFDLERNGGGPLVFDDGLHKFSIFWSLLGRRRRGACLDRLDARRGRRARFALGRLAALGERRGRRPRGRQRPGAPGADALLLAG